MKINDKIKVIIGASIIIAIMFLIYNNRESKIAYLQQVGSIATVKHLGNHHILNFINAIINGNTKDLETFFLEYPDTQAANAYLKAFESGSVVSVWGDNYRGNQNERTIAILIKTRYKKERCITKRNEGEALFIFKEKDDKTTLDWFNSGAALTRFF